MVRLEVAAIQDSPFSKECKDVILSLLGKPLVSLNEQFNLTKICLEDLRSKISDKVLCKCKVIFLQG